MEPERPAAIEHEGDAAQVGRRNGHSTVALFRNVFAGRDDAYGMQRPEQAPRSVREPLTDRVVAAHLRGEMRVGVYVVRDDATVTFSVVDFDGGDKDFPLAVKFCEAAESMKLHPYLEVSRGKGWHVWLFFREPVLASLARRALRVIADEIHLPASLEIFPKQDRVEQLGEGLGNFIFLPLNGLEQVQAGRTVFLDWRNDCRVFDDPVAPLRDVQYSDRARLEWLVESQEKEAGGEPREPGSSWTDEDVRPPASTEAEIARLRPLVDAIRSRGVDAGQGGARHAAALVLGYFLRAEGWPIDVAISMARAINARFRPPLEERDLEHSVGDGFERGWLVSAEQLASLKESLGADATQGTKDFITFDAADRAVWPCREIDWLVEPILATEYVMYEHGLAKTFKSFRALDMAFCVAHGIKYLDRFNARQGRVLYCANEDRLRRIKDRLGEIEIGHGRGPAPRGHLEFVPIRDQEDPACRHIDLTDLIDRGALIRRGKGRDVIFLDMVAYMMGDLDEDKKTDFGKFAVILREIQDSTGAALAGVEHDRKLGQGPRQRPDEPDPQDLRGTGAKYGLVDCISSARRPTDERRVLVRIENRDHDEIIKLGVYIAPKDSGELKVSAFDLEKAAEANRAKGREHKARVREALSRGPSTVKKLAEAVNLAPTTVQGHLDSLRESGEVTRSDESHPAYVYSLANEIANEMDSASRKDGANANETNQLRLQDGIS